MALKDTWTPQDDTMVADPEVVNIIADAVIKNEEDIKDLKENGGGGGVSQEYVDNALLPKIEIWQPNTKYTEGQIVFGTWENKGYMQSAILECIVSHRSFGNSAYLAPDYWKALSYLSAHFAYTAVMDESGNEIIRTYATKKELGDIETALDSIIAMQNELIGGESV